MKRRRQTHRRGRTRPGRLRLADELLRAKDCLPRVDHLRAVDVGFGDSIGSTLEWTRLLFAIAPQVTVYGIEQDGGRVNQARKELSQLADSDPLSRAIYIKQGGFSLEECGLENVHLIRCFNVLRGYGLLEATFGLRQLMANLEEGGLLMEGTSDVEGHTLSCHLWRKLEGRSVYGGLLLATDFTRGFSPKMFRDVLPRDLRRHFVSDEPIYQLLMKWDAVVARLRDHSSCRAHSSAIQNEKNLYLRSLQQLRQMREVSAAFPIESVDLSCHHRIEGAAMGLLWTPSRPSPRVEVMSPDSISPGSD